MASLSIRLIPGWFSSVIRLSPFDTSTPEGRSRERHRRALLSAVASGIAKILSVAATLVSVPLTLHYLGVERFGLWMTIASVVAMLAFADFGVGNGLLTAVSHADGRRDSVALKESVSSAFAMLCGFAIVWLALFGLLYPHISWEQVFNVKTQEATGELGLTVIVFAICFSANLPLGLAQRLQAGMQRGFYASMWQGIAAVATLAGIAVVVYFRGGLPWLCLAVLGVPALIGLLNTVVCLGFQQRDLWPRVKYVRWRRVVSLGKAGLLFFVLQAVVAVTFASDNMIIAHLLGTGAVVEYGVTEKMFALIGTVVTISLMPFWPAYGEATARGDSAWAWRTFKMTLVAALSFSAACALTLLIFAPQILALWVGNAVSPPLLLLGGFALWKVIEAAGNAISIFLNAQNAMGIQVVTAILTGITAFGSKLLLIPSIGAAGAVWATCICYSVCTLLPVLVYLYRRVLPQLRLANDARSAHGA